MTEITYLNEAGVTVTNARYMFGQGKNLQTHAMSGITAISQSADYTGWVFAGIFGLIGLMSMLGSVVAGIFFLVLAGLLYHFKKPKHWVVTTSASGASKGFVSRDKELVGRVVAALNESIINRQ